MLIIQSIASGMALTDIPAAVQFVITGGVLFAAVVIDSLSTPLAEGTRAGLTGVARDHREVRLGELRGCCEFVRRLNATGLACVWDGGFPCLACHGRRSTHVRRNTRRRPMGQSAQPLPQPH